MKSPKEILQVLKETFNALTQPAPPPPPPVAFTDYTLQDGTTTVSISDLNPGGTVMIKDATGAESPAPAGDVTLQDGTVITVAEGGVIAAVTPVAPPAQPTLPAGMLSQEQLKAHWDKFSTSVNLEDLTKLVKALFEDRFGWQIRDEENKAAVELYKENFAAKETEITTLKESFTKYKADSEKVTGQLLSLVELLVQEPVADPDPSATNGKNITRSTTKEDFAKALFSKKEK